MKLLLALLLLLTCAQPTRDKELHPARARRTVQVERWGILWTVEVEE